MLPALWETAGRWLSFRLDPETAHRMAIKGLKSGMLPVDAMPADPRLAVTVAGLTVPNPVGVAAGFDKDAEAPDALLKIGFGFTEIGTTTLGAIRPHYHKTVTDRLVGEIDKDLTGMPVGKIERIIRAA